MLRKAILGQMPMRGQLCSNCMPAWGRVKKVVGGEEENLACRYWPGQKGDGRGQERGREESEGRRRGAEKGGEKR